MRERVDVSAFLDGRRVYSRGLATTLFKVGNIYKRFDTDDQEVEYIWVKGFTRSGDIREIVNYFEGLRFAGYDMDITLWGEDEYYDMGAVE